MEIYMTICYGYTSDPLTRMNGIHMGSPTYRVKPNDFGMAPSVLVGGFTNAHTAILCDQVGVIESFSSFSIQGMILTGADVNTQQYFLGQYPRPKDCILPVIGIRGGRFVLYLSSNGTSWDIANNVQPSFTVTANKSYGFKLKCTYASSKYTYKLFVMQGTSVPLIDVDLTPIWSKETTTPLYTEAWDTQRAYISFGNHTWGVNQQSPFLGEIYLNECRVYSKDRIVWSGSNRRSSISHIYRGNREIKSVYKGNKKLFGQTKFLNYVYGVNFSTPTNTHSARLPFDITNPGIVKVSDYPIAIPILDNFSLNFLVEEVDANGKPTKIKQYKEVTEYSQASTDLANQKCFGIVDGINTNGIYRGFGNWGVPCAGKFKVGDKICVFSLLTGNDKVARFQIKTDGCLYYSASVYNQSLCTGLGYVYNTPTAGNLTQQFIP